MFVERHFQPIFGDVVTLTNVIDLDENTIMGDCAKTRGTKIFSKDFEVTTVQKNITSVIKLTEKKLELLKELQSVIKNEDKRYHLKHDDAASRSIHNNYSDSQTEYRFLLFDRLTEGCACYGDKSRIKSYLRRKKIAETNVILGEIQKFGDWTKKN